MLSTVLSNVSIGTANLLANLMFVVVAVFLLSGPAITYYYWRRNKRMKPAEPTDSA